MAYNFDKEVSTLIAKPVNKDKIPLYSRVDGGIDIGNNKVVQTNDNHSVCNSPDNLKRIFITGKGVFVHLHRPVKGRETSGTKRRYSYNSNIEKVIAKRRELYNKGIKTGGAMLRADKDCDLRGFGIGALVRNHVYQNVEEIYFDWSVISGIDSSASIDFSTYLGNSDNKFDVALKMLVSDVCGKGVDNVLNRFARLQTIGFIEHLDCATSFINEIIDVNGSGRWINAICEYNNTLSAFEKAVGTVKCIKIKRNLTGEIGKWSCKDGLYIFDRDILKPYINKLSFSKEGTDKENEINKCYEEKVLDELMICQGQKFVVALIKACYYNGELSNKFIQDRFTANGAKKYMGMFKSAIKK